MIGLAIRNTLALSASYFISVSDQDAQQITDLI